jgi:hypothetical protein
MALQASPLFVCGWLPVKAQQYKSNRSVSGSRQTCGAVRANFTALNPIKATTSPDRWFNLNILAPWRKAGSETTQEEWNMPEHDLQSQLAELRSQLAQDTPLTEEERASLQVIAQDIELRLANQGVVDHNDSLVDGVNLAVERFEVSHPNTAMTLRNIMQTLANMGI